MSTSLTFAHWICYRFGGKLLFVKRGRSQSNISEEARQFVFRFAGAGLLAVAL